MGVRPNGEDPGGPDEYPGERGTDYPVHDDRRFERVPLGTVVVSAHPDVQSSEARRILTEGAPRDLAGEQDETGARA